MPSDPKTPSPRTIAELRKLFEDAAARLRRIILAPPGTTDNARAFNASDAARRLAEVDQALTALKRGAARWTGPAIEQALATGDRTAVGQLARVGFDVPDFAAFSRTSFSVLPRGAIERLAADTAGDLIKAANAMGQNAQFTLRHMAATGVSNKEVNDILAGRWAIEGKPREAILQLKRELEKVHGEKVTITGKDGVERTYDTQYYADLVARSKMNQASEDSQHARLTREGVDLVQVRANLPSKNPCQQLVGRIFSLSGDDPKHPAWSTVSAGQLPYRYGHPHCHKYTIPFIPPRTKATEGTHPLLQKFRDYRQAQGI